MTTAQEYLELAEKAFWRSQHQQSIEYCTEAIRLDPTLAEAYNVRAFAWEEEHGGPDEVSLADLDEAVRLEPNEPQRYWNRGFSREYKDADGAIEDYTVYIKLKPEDGMGYKQRGQVFDKQHNGAAAIADFQKAVELYTAESRYGLVDLYDELGRTCKRYGELDLAISVYQNALALIQANYHFYALLAAAYVDKNDTESAIQALTQFLEVNPRNAFAYKARMKLYESSGDQAHFEADWAQYEKYRIDDGSRAYMRRGKSRAAVGNLEGAIADFGEALRCYPKLPEAHYYRGVAHELKGHIDEALADYSAALALDDRYIDAYIDRAVLYSRIGNYANAISDLETVLTQQPASKLEQDIRAIISQWT